MITILALQGETACPTFLAAEVVFLAEIPTTRSLTEIPGDRGLVPDLRRRSARCNLRECGPPFLYLHLFGELRKGCQGADAQRTTRALKRHSSQLVNLADIYKQRRRDNVFFEYVQQVHTTSLQYRVRVPGP
jgi:hypothetical protein